MKGNAPTCDRPAGSLWWVAILVVAVAGTALLAQGAAADSLVLVGVGTSGSWVTEVTVSNATMSGVNWQLSPQPSYETVCPGFCNFVNVSVPAAGTATLASLPASVTRNVVNVLYFTPESGPAVGLSVRARVVNSIRPTQAIEVPAFKLSTLNSLNPSVLAFSGARRDAASRTNLVLANVTFPFQQGRDVALSVEARAMDGRLLGSETIVVRIGQAFFLVDVLAELGVTTLDVGQIRVTKVAGDGVFWGTMLTTTSDGGVSVSVGAHP